ncbi:DUF1819 family protein [Mycolicibacterium mageritense]|uniref:DUF1819 family protein n=1 Tax=Mycolicibacterium mageritense TaxID=53462 RepID=UPI0023F09E97|nr:DUF1819 family protein [Mycolicibacterium mageritense]
MSDVGVTLINFVDDKKDVHAMEDKLRYALSFTSGALLIREASVAAPIYLREHDWAKVRQLIDEDNLLQARTVATGQRRAREVTQRLAVLTDDELELLVDATTSERGHLLWAAACRRYGLIGEFAEEVLRERFLLLTPTLDHDDFDSFIRSKAIWHEEVAALKGSTLRKLRSNVFRMLVEAGLLSEDGRILPVVLSTRVTDALTARTPSDIRFYPTGGGVR